MDGNQSHLKLIKKQYLFLNYKLETKIRYAPSGHDIWLKINKHRFSHIIKNRLVVLEINDE